MKRKYLVIFGNIEFHNDTATVFDIYDTLLVETADPNNIDEEAERIMEKDGYDCYLIPQLYAGEVIFK